MVSQAAHVVRGQSRVLDDHRPGPGRTHAGHLREDHAELGHGVVQGERGAGRRAHSPPRHFDPDDPLDQLTQGPQVLRAVGHRHAGPAGRQDPAQLADRRAAIWHEVEQVGGEHHAESAITDWQRGHVGVDQRRVRRRVKHARRPVTPDRAYPPLTERPQVDAVTAAGVEDPRPWRQPGQIQHPRGDVEGRDLTPPQALPGVQVAVVGVLPGGIQLHQLTMPRPRPGHVPAAPRSRRDHGQV